MPNKSPNLAVNTQKCLHAYAQRLQALQPEMYIARHELLQEIEEFLQRLASISPHCAVKLQNLLPLSAAKTHQLLLALAADPKLAADIESAQAKVTQAKVQQQAQASAQSRHALAEQRDKVEKIHKASIDSLPHDKQRALGDLIEDVLRVNYVVPFEAEYYPQTVEYKADSSNSYEDLLRSKFGDTIYEPVAPKA